MPPLHPLIVHFPIALLTAALLADAGARLFKTSGLSRAGWWSQLVGTIGLAAAVGSGLIAKESAGIQNAVAGSVLDAHQQWALWSLVLFAGLIFWRIAARTQLPANPRFVYWGLYCIAVVTLWLTAWHGGELVYGLGVGVSPR
jgi:uncharacterized membrane protein